MRAVLVSHADTPIGRRVVAWLSREERSGRVVAQGGAPARVSRNRGGGEPLYVTPDLARPGALIALSRDLRRRGLVLDALVHLPPHGPELRRDPAGAVARFASEARRLARTLPGKTGVRTVVAVGTAFVYRLPSGNASPLSEASPLAQALAGIADPLAPWLAVDSAWRRAMKRAFPRVVLLRVPAVLSPGGDVHLHPGLEGTGAVALRPLGFDPLCAVVSEADVARSIAIALTRPVSDVFNVAGPDALPLSVLARTARRSFLPVPGPVLRATATGAGWLRRSFARRLADADHLRWGLTLDVGRAERELGFVPRERLGGGGSPSERW